VRGSLAATLGAVALIAAACGGSGDPSAASSATTDEAATSVQRTTAEAVLMPTASGGELDFNSLRGQDVLLWFWAPW
jgi:ABC-type glycerol-3-phosphate transport system substrate-binding protein